MKELARAFLAALVIASCLVRAGPVYKCVDQNGVVTFSGAECPGQPEKLKIETIPSRPLPRKIEAEKPVSVRKATDEEISFCMQLVKISKKFKDPESLRIEGEPITGIYAYDRKKVFVHINGKNSYGAYAGSTPYICAYRKDGTLEDVQ